MEAEPFLIARDLTELHQAMKLVSRSGECVQCDDQSRLQCPICSSNESCQFTVPISCSQCPKSLCMANNAPSSSSGGGGGGGGGGGPSAGPIAGGVIGGVAVIAVVTYLVWRFLIKPKRRQSQMIFRTPENPTRDGEKGGAPLTRRGSTHTVHSIASTVLTRASNIIQIAYIPGVTNRAAPASPNVLVPPVPPIPMQHTEGSGDSANEDAHFFVPANLRDSTYSGISSFSDRTSYPRTSFAPRASITSTIYGKQAQVLTPAQTGMRAKPTVVSVKAAGSTPNTPPVPNVDIRKFSPSSQLRPQSVASNFSVGSTFLNNANTATQARAQVVKVGGSRLKKVEIASRSEASVSSMTLSSKVPISTPSSTSQGVSPLSDQGPFSDPSTPETLMEAQAPAPGGPIKGDGLSKTDDLVRGASPFGDEHATRD